MKWSKQRKHGSVYTVDHIYTEELKIYHYTVCTVVGRIIVPQSP